MARYQVILAYDGTGFLGFQRQANGRTVQGVVEDALVRIGWEGSSLLAAGRTDTGVHATGQVVSFDLPWRHSSDQLQKALNVNLPLDVAAVDVRPVSDRFHPRYDALSRRYCYRLFCQPVRDPFRERFAWRVWPPVELPALQTFARVLVGRFDFAAFGSPPKTGGSTTRTIFTASWQTSSCLKAKPDFHSEAEAGAPVLEFEIEAQAFLYHMVRRLVFVQVEAARNDWAVSDLSRLLEPGADPVQGLAPPLGLYLTSVHYPEGGTGKNLPEGLEDEAA